MPAVSPNPGAKVAAGVSSPNSGFPQWGVDTNGYSIKQASNQAQKNALVKQGYYAWFTSQSNAQSFVSAEQNPYESGNPQNAIPGLEDIGNFFHEISEAATWERVAEFIVGGLLVYIGFKAVITPEGIKASTQSLKQTGSRTVSAVKKLAKVVK